MLVSVSVVELFVVSMFSHRLGFLAKEERIRSDLLSLVGPLVSKSSRWSGQEVKPGEISTLTLTTHCSKEVVNTIWYPLQLTQAKQFQA